MEQRFIIAGGGTGGHIFPAIAIAQALQAQLPQAKFLFVGAKGKMEMEKVPQAGFNIIGLDIAGFNRRQWWKNFALPFKLVQSFFQVSRIFKDFQPTAVLGVGGYSSFPVLRYAQSKGIPTYLHESNAHAGKANQLLGKKATAVFVGMPGMERYFQGHNLVWTGNPVRQNIRTDKDNGAAARLHFGLQPNATTVLVVGGSLGANSINKAVLSALPQWTAQSIQLIWQTGSVEAQKFADAALTHPFVFVAPFLREMEKAYAAADIVVSRAGAMSVTEITVVGKPSILVPYPLAAEDHQTANAQTLVKAGAAILLPDAAVGQDLAQKVVELAHDPAKRKAMAAATLPLAIGDADQRIAQYIVAQLT